MDGDFSAGHEVVLSYHNPRQTSTGSPNVNWSVFSWFVSRGDTFGLGFPSKRESFANRSHRSIALVIWNPKEQIISKLWCGGGLMLEAGGEETASLATSNLRKIVTLFSFCFTSAFTLQQQEEQGNVLTAFY